MIVISGDYLEGGGSILRLATALSAVTSKPVRIINIRAGRKNPGLQAQHLAGIEAVAKICEGEVSGAKLNSTEVEFVPGKIVGGELEINIGTAGAISLVLQSLMIPAIHSNKLLDLLISGGTFVSWSPSIGYLQHVTLKVLKKMGYRGEILVKRHGFYPKGGGLVEAKLHPADLKTVDITETGRLHSIKIVTTISNDLKGNKIAERVRQFLQGRLAWKFPVKPQFIAEYVDSLNPGGGIDVIFEYEKTAIGVNAIFEKGKKAEDIADDVFSRLKREILSKAPVDEHLADQLLPYMALAGGGRIKVSAISSHCKTNIWVIEKFLPVKFEVSGNLIECNKV